MCEAENQHGYFIEPAESMLRSVNNNKQLFQSERANTVCVGIRPLSWVIKCCVVGLNSPMTIMVSFSTFLCNYKEPPYENSMNYPLIACTDV